MLRYYSLYYTIVAVIYILIVVKPDGVRRLWPAGVISALLIFGQTKFFGVIGAYGFKEPVLPVFNMPLFAITLSFCYGIIVMHHMPKNFGKRLGAILIFIVITKLADTFALYTGYHIHYNFPWYLVLIQDFVVTCLIVFFSEGIVEKRIKEHKQHRAAIG